MAPGFSRETRPPGPSGGFIVGGTHEHTKSGPSGRDCGRGTPPAVQATGHHPLRLARQGDHREDSSDLDLLLVTREEVDFQEQGQVERDALRRAMRTYGREARVNLLWVTREQLEQEGQYVNSSPTRAMLEGVVFSEHPERYRSRYDAVDPPTPGYNWSAYNAYLATSRQGLDAMIMVLQSHGGGADRRISSMMPEVMVRLLRQVPTNEESLQAYALEALRDALKAAIAGAGEVPRNHAAPTELADALGRLAPGEDLDTAIPLEAYERCDGLMSMTAEDFVGRVEETSPGSGGWQCA